MPHFLLIIVSSFGVPALVGASIGYYYQHKLQKISYEHQIKFSALHERRAKVIAETYSSLVTTVEALMGFLAATNSNMEAIEDKRAIAQDKYFTFHSIFSQSRIFYSRELAKKLERVDSQIFVELRTIEFSVRNNGQSDMKVIMEVLESAKALASETLDELEAEMRVLIGS